MGLRAQPEPQLLRTRDEKLLRFRDLLAEYRRRKLDRPLDFYRPIPKSDIFHKSKAKSRLYAAANRAGKSESGVAEDVRCAKGENPHWPELKAPNFGWVISLSNEIQRDVLQPKFEKYLAPKEIAHVTYRRSGVWDQIKLKCGSVIGFKSCEMGRSVMQGAALHWAHFDEEPPKDIYGEIKMRLTDYAGRDWLTMTPINGMTWVYDFFVDAGSPSFLPNSEVIHASIWDNAKSRGGYIPDEEIREKEASITDPIERAIRLYGEFRNQHGRVYKEYDPKYHVLEEIPQHFLTEDGKIKSQYDVYVSIDTGRCFAAGFYLVDYFGNVVKFHEYYSEGEGQENGTTPARARAILNILAQYDCWPEKFIIDPSSQFQADLAEFNIVTTHCMDNDPERGIGVVSEYMHVQVGKPIGLQYCNPSFQIVGPNCPETLREMVRYQWASPTKAGLRAGQKRNEPLKKDDHEMDCDRYLIVERPEASKPPAGERDQLPMSARILEHERSDAQDKMDSEGGDPWGLDNF